MSCRISAAPNGHARRDRAHHEGDGLLVVNVRNHRSRKFSSAHPGVEEQAYDRGVPAVLELHTCARLEQLNDLVEVEDRDGLLGTDADSWFISGGPPEFATTTSQR